MKKRVLFYLLSIALVAAVLVSQTYQHVTALTDNPAGTMVFVGKTEREVSVKAGEKLSVTVKMSNGEKVCNIILDTIVANQSRSVKQKVVKWNRGTLTGEVTADVDTAGLSPGKYRVFMEAYTNCPDNTVHGNEDDGFDCDGNPTCWSYCNGEGGRRDKIDTSTGAYQPRDPVVNNGNEIYRTTSNPAYYQIIPGQNSCGEPADGGSASDPNYRVGQCELKACDRSGKNLDNLTFNITDAGGNVPTPHGTDSPVTGGTPAPSASASSAPTGGNTVLPKAKDGSVTATNAKLTNTTVVDASAGLSSTSSTKTITLDGSTKTLAIYSGGSLTGKDIAAEQKIGSVGVSIGKGVTLVGPMTITNSDFADGTMTIPANTSVFGNNSWNGKISPLVKTTTSGGTPPAGFKLGSVVVKAGSNETPLIFDRPIELTIKSNATEFGYMPTGGTEYAQIQKCQGTFATPTNPGYPSECYVSDGTTVKIITWHLTDFAALDLNTSVNFIGSSGGICLDKANPNDVAIKVDWGANFGYSEYRIARTECSDAKTCNGPENFITTNFFPARVNPSMTYFDVAVEANKFYQYRVWGWRTGTAKPTGDTIASYDQKFWSLPVVVKASCEQQGTGINIQEFKVVPVQ